MPRVSQTIVIGSVVRCTLSGRRIASCRRSSPLSRRYGGSCAAYNAAACAHRHTAAERVLLPPCFLNWAVLSRDSEMSRIYIFLLLLSVARSSWGSDEYHRARLGATSRASTRNEEEADPAFWAREARAGIERVLANGAAGGDRPARNVVLFIGDGMSVPTLAAARTLLGQRQNRTGEEAQLFFETFPTVGLAKTYCVDGQIPDSACTATAYLCGVKTSVGTIGVSAAARALCDDPAPRAVDSIAAWALADGRDAGVVTSTRVTHASPSGAFAHVFDRDWESDADVAADCPGTPSRLRPRPLRERSDVPRDIAHQLVHDRPGSQFKVILGGGRREFLPTDVTDEEGTPGRRRDGRDLIDEWQADKEARGASHRYVWNREQLLQANESLPEYLLGLFEGSHLQYNLERDPDTEPTLAELVDVAVRSLSRNERGFFLFVEAGRIDHAHHDNYVELALDETIELAAAVRRAAELLPEEDSLIVVTADHSHTMTFNGYTRRGGDILGPSDDLGDDGVPYMTLSYANGPGHRAHERGARVDVTADADYRAAGWRAHAEVPLDSETHGGDDVAVFARGAHHALFAGLYEQSQIPHRMGYVACLGSGPTLCDRP